jgi:hypothetical protein
VKKHLTVRDEGCWESERNDRGCALDDQRKALSRRKVLAAINSATLCKDIPLPISLLGSLHMPTQVILTRRAVGFSKASQESKTIMKNVTIVGILASSSLFTVCRSTLPPIFYNRKGSNYRRVRRVRTIQRERCFCPCRQDD